LSYIFVVGWIFVTLSGCTPEPY